MTGPGDVPAASPPAPVDEAPAEAPDEAPDEELSDPAPAPADEAPEEVPASRPEGSDFRMVVVSSVTVDLPVQHPVVTLREVEAPRRHLSFSVGQTEGVALAHALRRVPTPRPLAHELMSDVLSGFDIDVVAVRMVGRQGRIYFAELDLRSPRDRRVHSCRPSDALAVALSRPVPVPILVDARLFDVDGDVPPS